MRKTRLAFIMIFLLAAMLVSCDLGLVENDKPQVYTVTYYTSSAGDRILASYECKLGDTIPVPSSTPGQEPFYGWCYYAEDGTALTFEDESQMKVAGNLIAIPANPVYQYVSFDYIFEGDFGNEEQQWMYVITGEEIEFPAPPEKEGYTFAGWYRNRALTEKVEGPVTCTEGGNYFYGYYTSDIPIHTLHFEGIDVEKQFLDGTCFEHDYSIPSAPSSAAFSFAGWYFDSSFEERLYPETPITSDATMHPRYVEPEIIDVSGTYFLMSNGEVYDTDTKRVVFSGISAIEHYNGHLHLFREDGRYHLGNSLPDSLHEIGSGAGKIVQSARGETFLAIVDDSGRLFIKGNVSGGGAGGPFSLMDRNIGQVVQIDANRNTLAIRNSDNELYMIGKSFDSPSGEYSTWTKVFSDVKDFSLGNSAIYVIDGNGDLWFRGVRNNTRLQGAGDVSYEFMKIDSCVTSVAGYQGDDIADGSCNYYLYTKDDGVYVYGTHNLYGTGVFVEADPAQLMFPDLARVENFSKAFVFFDHDGKLYMRGSLDDLPVDYDPYVHEPYAVLSGERVTQVSTAGWTAFALTGDGDLYYWGEDEFNSLNTVQATPRLILSGIKTIGGDRAASEDDVIYDLTWAVDGKPEAVDTYSFSGQVQKMKGDYVLTKDGELWHVGSSASSVYAMDDDVTDFFLYGDKLFGYTYEEDGSLMYKSLEDELAIGNVVKAVRTGHMEVVLLEDGSIWWKGINSGERHGLLYPRVADGSSSAVFTILDASRRFKDIAVIGGSALFLIGQDERLVALGDTRYTGFKSHYTDSNPYFQCLAQADSILELSQDNLADSIAIQSPDSLYLITTEIRGNIIDSSVEELSHGHSYSHMTTSGGAYLAIDEDGQLWSWGDNSEGLCGNGESRYSAKPVLIDFSSWTVS